MASVIILAIGLYNVFKDKNVAGEETAATLENILEVQPKPNRLAGIIGALLGTLVGALLWAIVGALGYISGWIGFLMFSFALIGYRMFTGREDRFGTVISLIFCLIAVIPATFLGSGWSYYKALNEYMPGYYNLYQAMKLYPDFLADSGNMKSLLIDIGLGYFLMIVSALRRMK